jgi:zona occludens toxin
MSIKIHYGPNGTYKTSGAIQDDLIPAFLAGRTIVTNIRGLSRERLFDALSLEIDPGGEVIEVECDTQAGMDRMARFFHWAPPGALIFVDEASSIWPKSWRPDKIAQLDYPGGPLEAEKVDRPMNFYQAFEKHRHWNWDLVLTTPNIKKIRDEIRECSDGAYKHKNLALIGWGGRYIEGFHMSDDSGANQNDFISVNKRKIKPTTFKCYDSTKTGKVSDTISGRSLFKNPRVMLLLVVLGLAFFLIARKPVPAVLGGKPQVAVASSSAAAVAAAPAVPEVDRAAGRLGIDGNRVAAMANAVEPSLIQEFKQGSFAVVGYMSKAGRSAYMLRFDGQGARGGVVFSSDELVRLGMMISERSDCAAELSYGSSRWLALCSQVALASPSTSMVAPTYQPAQAIDRRPTGSDSARAGMIADRTDRTPIGTSKLR